MGLKRDEMVTSRDSVRAPQLQDSYLAECLRQSVPVVVYLMNGFQLRGLVRGYDAFTIVLEYEKRAHLIYKHAVSTISPEGPLTGVLPTVGQATKA